MLSPHPPPPPPPQPTIPTKSGREGWGRRMPEESWKEQETFFVGVFCFGFNRRDHRICMGCFSTGRIERFIVDAVDHTHCSANVSFFFSQPNIRAKFHRLRVGNSERLENVRLCFTSEIRYVNENLKMSK